MANKKPSTKQNSLVEKVHHSLMAKSPLYSDWHNHPHQHKVQMVIFVMVLAVVAGLVALKFQGMEHPPLVAIQTKAAEQQYWNDQEVKISDATKNLLILIADFRKADTDEKAELLPMIEEAAKARYYMIAAAAEKRPEVVLHTAIPGALRRNMPAEASQYVEEEVNKEGILAWLVGDDFVTSTKKETFLLKDSRGKNLELKFSEGTQPKALTDSHIRVNGYQLNDKVVVKDSENAFQVLAATTAPVNRRTAVILFNFQNNTTQPYTVEHAREKIFTGANSAKSYYQQASFGGLNLVGSLNATGDVFGWYTLPSTYRDPNTGQNIDIGWNIDCQNNYFENWKNLAEQAASRDRFSAANYDTIIYGFPQGQCGWNGIATLGGAPGRAWINDNGITAIGQPTLLPVGVVTHELGHTYGRTHASIYNCFDDAGARVSVSYNCSIGHEYGDQYDVMGNWNAMRLMNNYHKGNNSVTNLGWWDASNTLTLNRTDGDYTLLPQEMVTSGTQVIRIPHPIIWYGTTNSGYLYLEYRQPSGYDNFPANDPAATGVSLRLSTDYNNSSLYANSLLLDTTPATTGFNDAMLQVGQTFTDPTINATITVLSADATGAVVHIAFGPEPCVSANPTVTVTPSSQTVQAGLSATYNVTIRNNDPVACGIGTFDITPSIPAGWTQTPANWSESIPAGGSVTRQVVVTTPNDASSGYQTISESVANRNFRFVSGYASFFLNVQGVDRTAPTVNVTKPTNGTAIGKGKMQIAASAYDNVYVTSIKLYIDSTLIKTCVNSTTCSVSYNANNLPAGSHTIKAVAGDYAGNSSTSTISVTK